ncbi:major capsid protein [Microviridae sp.]|nr:major capsid protein [Microviridae sp.]
MRRSKHTLSNYRLSTFDQGQLIPVECQEMLPGDSVQAHTSAMIRVSPLAAPVMHPVTIRVHKFFSPTRLIAQKLREAGKTSFDWEQFITGGKDGQYSEPIPTATVETYGSGTTNLWDHLSVSPTAVGAEVNSMPLAGINDIFNEWYRDQDLVTERDLYDTTIPNIAWEKDYFSAARPWTQRGPAVTLPIGDQAPVTGIGVTQGNWAQSNVNVFETTGLSQYATAEFGDTAGGGNLTIEKQPGANLPNVYADLTSATGADIIDVRRAFALQRYQEARARYGTRFSEYLRYMGVRPSDQRLDRPELLSGSTSTINFSEVLQTAQPPAGGRTDYGVGDMYGHGVAAFKTRKARRFIEEHGYLYTFVSVRPKAMYYKGMPRHFLKTTKEDYWQKELEAIGQQAILQGEIYGSPGLSFNEWAYSDRYQEYRTAYSTVAGEFRDILDYWHMGRDLPSNTALNEDFIKCVPTKRIHNVQTNNALWAMVNNHTVARRLVSKSAYSKVL